MVSAPPYVLRSRPGAGPARLRDLTDLDRAVPGAWRNGSGSFLGVDHAAIAVSDSARSAGFFGSVFGFRTGGRTENRGPEQADLDNVDDVHVSVTRHAPDLPAPRMELLDYLVGTRRLGGRAQTPDPA